jgi:hypothetical protein
MHASVMVLTAHGYITAAKGSNGFVCIVTRSWDNTADVPGARFWDPRIRVPYCVNPAGARSMLAEYLTKSQWVLAGASQAEIGERVKAARTMGNMAGSICYMMSKLSWGVAGMPGAWRPHLMFYFPHSEAPDWGADMDGIPIYSGPAETTPPPIRYWCRSGPTARRHRASDRSSFPETAPFRSWNSTAKSLP